ncbi:NAD(P)/FAD-dependent oxidoreductase [Sphingomonas oryzagri]|uniref:FAD-dependent oxidoreductase n=1 Tax=Sphingomonas oryzagri TaxID=3042314 RepID=A0ABT6MWT3_9SPHN|nr:FAD-dependent oxidoreductase [Sphingomonas oryzagri]MDH7637514.1 FAD-dependent oxidoreductase [Sphingomonas oryzagri]
MKRYDVVVVGAGMAGASLAAELAPHASVLIVEAESLPGYHATGRSAAFWSETYGGPGVQPLTSASGLFLREGGFLRDRGALHLAAPEHFALLDRFIREFADTGIALLPLDEAAIAAQVPGLRTGAWRGLLEASTADIDVAALHAHYLHAAKVAGADLACSAPLRFAGREGGRWRIDAGGVLTVEADILVDAAGAWADAVARVAGAGPIGIQPYRRTIAQLRVSPDASEDLPLVIDAAERFYFKPEAGGRLWLSPHDETPSVATDAAPEEIDVAVAIDRMEQVVDWRVERVERSWAGLRSFAPDRLPVYGFDAAVPGFFWFAGQGGFGIQTAPAAARLGAAVLLGRPVEAGLDAERYAPGRFSPA